VDKFSDKTQQEYEPMTFTGIAILALTLITSDFSGEVSHATTMKSCPSIQLQSKSKPGTQVHIQTTAEKTILKIHCPSGIDHAVLKRTVDHWPKSMEVQLHLSGLESFRVHLGQTFIQWNVSSTGERVICTIRNGDQQEKEITSESPLFAEVQIVAKKTQVPLQNGYFKILLPEELLKGSSETMQMQWIDFYRN
tara:strand:+ start:1080 stop:1661 length:582 start_codon:yes stop_codon:yes gene_type:complete